MFIEWTPRNSTHQTRFTTLISRHMDNVTKLRKVLRDCQETGTLGSLVMMSDLSKIYGELSTILEECVEAIEDINNDNLDLKEVFLTFKKEIEKLPDDTP
jgi:hypothetical protein